MRTVLDFSQKFTVTDTIAQGTHTYTYPSNDGRVFVLQEISVDLDSNMKANGEVQIKINGQPATGSGDASTSINPANSFSVKYDSPHLITFVESGSDIVVQLGISSGSGTAQVLITGWELMQREADTLRGKLSLQTGD